MLLTRVILAAAYLSIRCILLYTQTDSYIFYVNKFVQITSFVAERSFYMLLLGLSTLVNSDLSTYCILSSYSMKYCITFLCEFTISS